MKNAADIASVMDEYYKLGYARKPEAMKTNLFGDNYDENFHRLADYGALMAKADAINQKIPADRRDALTL